MLVHLAVLTFTMSYVTCDFWPYVPKPEREGKLIKHAITFSVTQTASSSCGFLFPFATNGNVYAVLFSFAFSCYLVCLLPLHQRWLQLSGIGAEAPNALVMSSARLCFFVSLATVVTWTMFVLNYVTQPFLDVDPSTPFVVDVVVDVISKLLLAGLFSHLQDAVVREQERQHQIRTERLMSKIWKVRIVHLVLSDDEVALDSPRAVGYFLPTASCCCIACKWLRQRLCGGCRTAAIFSLWRQNQLNTPSLAFHRLLDRLLGWGSAQTRLGSRQLEYQT